LDPEVRPGAVGIVDPSTGNFRGLSASVPDLDIERYTGAQDWKMASKHVHRSEGAAQAGANIGAVGGSVAVSWEFSEEQTIASQFAVDHEQYVNSATGAIRGHWDFLLGLARDVNFAQTGDVGIGQGFGVVTGVIYARSGLNIGSRSEGSKFSISGSVEGIKSMLGEVKGSASFQNQTQSSDVDSQLWPATPGTQAVDPVPIGFTFMSFEDRLLIPNWTMPIKNLQLQLVNRGSYIVKATVTYRDASGKAQTKKERISGGYKKMFALPLEATDVELDLDFVATSQDHKLRWRSPLGEWTDGDQTVVLRGFWPGKTDFSLR
jgi:hypothetical protein